MYYIIYAATYLLKENANSMVVTALRWSCLKLYLDLLKS